MLPMHPPMAAATPPRRGLRHLRARAHVHLLVRNSNSTHAGRLPVAATTQHPASAARALARLQWQSPAPRRPGSRQAAARSAPLTPHTAPGKCRARPTHLPGRSGNHPHRAVPAGRRQVCAVGQDCDVVQPAPAHSDDDSGTLLLAPRARASLLLPSCSTLACGHRGGGGAAQHEADKR